MSGGLFTATIEEVVDTSQREVDGKILTRPALLTSDSAASLTYCADVDIGQKRIDPNTGDEEIAILRNVPIAAGEQTLIYADVGSAVRLRRSESGRFEIVGYSKRIPGTYTRTALRIGTRGPDPVDYEVSDAVDVSISARPLTYEEIHTIGGGYGICRYGAVGVFRGATLVEVR